MNLEKEVIANRLEKIIQEWIDFGGIANFFGHQRFGTRRPISHLIGKLIVQGKIKEAIIEYITKIYPDEAENIKLARKTYLDTNDAGKARELFPQNMVFERRILKHLVNRSNDFIGAFNVLPKNLQRMFVHAYQSYLWNLSVSERIRINGNLLPQADDIKENNEIVFPIIGYNSELLENEIFDFIRNQLEVDNIQLKNFELKKLKNLKFPGSNRRLYLNPIKTTWQLQSDEKNPYVKIMFALNSGSYATVLLRELMKASPINY
jgi:tRNA pseudouridine13 synthase